MKKIHPKLPRASPKTSTKAPLDPMANLQAHARPRSHGPLKGTHLTRKTSSQTSLPPVFFSVAVFFVFLVERWETCLFVSKRKTEIEAVLLRRFLWIEGWCISSFKSAVILSIYVKFQGSTFLHLKFLKLEQKWWCLCPTICSCFRRKELLFVGAFVAFDG